MDNVIKDFIAYNRNAFEDVQTGYAHAHSVMKSGVYTCLNYGKILKDIIDYLDGYQKYKDEDDERFRNKIDESTVAFYDGMFANTDKYRKEIGLDEFRQISVEFLQMSKNLQTKLHEIEKYIDVEASRIIHITEKQYRKLSKVMDTDMEIYLWLSCGKTVPLKVKTAFDDKYAPVIHRKSDD